MKRKIKINDDEREILTQTNWIEKEYSQESVNDAIVAWNYAKIFKKNININYIKKIHKKLMCRIDPSIAGKFRDVDIRIGGRLGMKPDKILQEMRDWCINAMIYGNEKKIKYDHVKFEKIHPFYDGNGRVGRILMNAQMIREGFEPLLICAGQEIFEYYNWFRDNKRG